jgi:hypothetical protein
MCEILSSTSSSDRTTFSSQLTGRDFSGWIVSSSQLARKDFSTSQLGRQDCFNQAADLLDMSSILMIRQDCVNHQLIR